jgi:DNA-binding beta-propeller fold protein YncE
VIGDFGDRGLQIPGSVPGATSRIIEPGSEVAGVEECGSNNVGVGDAVYELKLADAAQSILFAPVYGVVSGDNSTLWVSNFSSDSINLWSIDDGQMAGSVRTGNAPDALAFSADEHLLLAADAHSGDVSVIRTADKNGPALFTILPAGGSPNAIVVKAMQGKP